jgi:Arc/MetJ-type ribon-helix-helix transcriptional regulator
MLKFVDQYEKAHACKSRSEVIQKALKLLRQQELAEAYKLANEEIDPLWENTTDDGLSHETW